MILTTSKNGELGTENIKTLFTILLSLYAQLKKLIEKFDLLSVVNFATELLKYRDDIGIFKQAWAEFKDLKIEDGEVNEISLHLEQEGKRLGLFSENFILIIKDTLDLVVDVFDLWTDAKGAYEKSIILYDRIRSISVAEKIQSA